MTTVCLKFNSLYNLTRFDTINNSWETIALNTSMFDNSIDALQLTEFSTNFYKNKLYILRGFVPSNDKQAQDHNIKLGILDYKESQWSWSLILDEAGSIYNSTVDTKYSLIYNDQLILISGKHAEKDSDRFQVFDLNSQRIKPTMKASYIESDTENTNSTGPRSSRDIYYTIGVSVGFTVAIMLAIFYFYLKYKYNKTSPRNRDSEPKKSMEAVWSNPEEQNIEHILYGVKENDIYFNSDIIYSKLKLKNHMPEIANNTQVYFTPLPGTISSSTTLYSYSSNFSAKSSNNTLN
ncbi:hypothetical protein CONCODRAFT_142764 [Conidiobolus coronatus NRRL 28638]|uniref:Uncharacterized protein n=1 Tax=Conidiobolus coronatus (strain ATCC 28846 / CBS 209.66 / NRRL 28638) TaxID=796925 RepID=A0A137NRN7_CONC2|nr:hypothetical protein CONCODRAFT_142764 [Conidiobolus coronatus NRRL 28638]|eukprot:KXN65384.1 hypothetical protein CONCODRAFT_142764 [Conidiobolus coronatus NRRL 28638]